MHCPRCGQSQISEETRFCSRCGFPLGLVSEVLAHGGFLPQLADLHNKKKKFWTRCNGMKVGLAWFLVLALLVTPIMSIFIEEIALVIAAFGFITGLLMMIFSWMFLEKSPKIPALDSAAYQAASYLGGNAASPNALPSPPAQQDFFPPAGVWKAPNTGEMIPHSVTEGTTKLFQKDE